MNKIDPEICEFYYLSLDEWCPIIASKCNPNHPDCEYEDERNLGVDESLWEEWVQVDESLWNENP